MREKSTLLAVKVIKILTEYFGIFNQQQKQQRRFQTLQQAWACRAIEAFACP